MKGIRHLVIETAEFSEAGDEGKRLQEEISACAREFGMRFLGPNCLGTLNAHNKFCCFFGIIPGLYDEVFDRPGAISYVIQSGGVGALIIDSFRKDITNVNKMVSIGNKEDVDEADLIEYFNGDNTEVICLYLENVKNGRKLLETAKRIRKPVLVYKGGRTARLEGRHVDTAGWPTTTSSRERLQPAGIVRLIRSPSSIPSRRCSRHAAHEGESAWPSSLTRRFGAIRRLIVESGLELASFSEDDGAPARHRQAL